MTTPHGMTSNGSMEKRLSQDASSAEAQHVHQEYYVGGNDEGKNLSRSLQSRHIQFLALGGAIGTGLFIGAGAILNATGPAPLFIGYTVLMAIVWCVMNVLGEIATYLPLSGITVPYFVDRFLCPSLAFAAGWNYWYAYAMLVGAEATAAGIIINYWDPPFGIWVTILIVLAVMLFLNLMDVRYFGEAEFWFASIKLITIMGLIILGICIFFGLNQDGVRGFRYWKPNNPGAFAEYNASGSLGNFLAVWHAIVAAGFAFITSPELIAISAGETVSPRRNIPKAARRFVWRLAVFYGLGSLIIGIMVPYTNERLLGGGDAGASPFVIGIQEVGIKGLNHVINAAVLTSAWSAGNSFLYSGSRVLYSMALTGQAPKIFRKTNKFNIPYVAVLFTWAFGLLAFLNVSNDGAQVFNWFVNISTISGYIAWIVVLMTYIRFRKAIEYNNLLSELPFRTPLQPYMSWVVMIFLIILTLTNGFQIFIKGNWDVANFIAAYITLPLFLILYLGHKFVYPVWVKRKHGISLPFRWAIPTEEVDVTTGKKEMDAMELNDQPRVAKNWLQKVWQWIA